MNNQLPYNTSQADKIRILTEALEEISQDNPDALSDRDELIRCAAIAREALGQVGEDTETGKRLAYSCDLCTDQFWTADALEAHIKNLHP